MSSATSYEKTFISIVSWCEKQTTPRAQELQFEDVVTEAPETEAPPEPTEVGEMSPTAPVVNPPEELDAMQMATWFGWLVLEGGWLDCFLLHLLIYLWYEEHSFGLICEFG